MSAPLLPLSGVGPNPLLQTRPGAGKPRGHEPAQADANSFGELLQRQTVKLSRHAEIRLQQRGIQLKNEQWHKINDAIDQAASKGARDSLILLNGMAFIVNVRNRTIITALEPSSMQSQVITQIDSAVIAD